MRGKRYEPPWFLRENNMTDIKQTTKKFAEYFSEVDWCTGPKLITLQLSNMHYDYARICGHFNSMSVKKLYNVERYKHRHIFRSL